MDLSEADSEDLPIPMPGPNYFSMPEVTPWLNTAQKQDKALSLENLRRGRGIFDPTREKVKKVIWSKIADKVRIATGPGEHEGSKHHSLEIDLVNVYTAKSLFWDVPRTGPTKRGN